MKKETIKIIEQKITDLLELLNGDQVETDYDLLLSNIERLNLSLDRLNGNNIPEREPMHKMFMGQKFDFIDNGIAVFMKKDCHYCDSIKKNIVKNRYLDFYSNIYTFNNECSEGKELIDKYEITAFPISVVVKNNIITHIEIGYEDTKTINNLDRAWKAI